MKDSSRLKKVQTKLKISEGNQKHTSTIGISAFVLASSIFVTNSQFALEPPQAIAQ